MNSSTFQPLSQGNMGFMGRNTGFGQGNMGFMGRNTGFGQGNMGFMGRNTGFGQSNMGFMGRNTGFGQSNMGFMDNMMYNEYIGTGFLILSMILSVIFVISVLTKNQLENNNKVMIIMSWVIFGLIFTYMLNINNNTIFNFSISIFIIIISCLLTFRQVNAIKTCVV
jgi:hypothetical protein